ncbi:MAG: hypothetical protein PHU49_04540 [Syntrophorhabdaceae bacterium]|nr:hypothetical protein [Syntrophorhabdaceae bacterium]MDD5243264.1 hypothetical protein [Syntrophorhabdaceae bacterium]
MEQAESTPLVQSIMDQFAALTGLSPGEKSPRRYLWTDAFAVCNFLRLYLRTKDEKYRELALRLVEQVHNVLGRHRADDTRTGWISGLSEKEGRSHPTCGGLRIGKALNEHKPGDPVDERLEWEQDGQYFHYLTKWMHALNRVSAVTGDFVYNRWAMELAKTAHARFVYVLPRSGRKSMYWKMSIDLSYPLVRSMGHHDPLDGFITYSQLQSTGAKDTGKPATLDLAAMIGDMAHICEGKNWQTDDPLGLGSLLSDAYKAAQLISCEAFGDADLLRTLLTASIPGLKSCVHKNFLGFSAAYRLAFREFGLSIGLHAVERLENLVKKDQVLSLEDLQLQALLKSLRRYVPLGEEIEAFWLKSANQASETWTEHRDINMVMLATSLAPDGYLAL